MQEKKSSCLFLNTVYKQDNTNEPILLQTGKSGSPRTGKEVKRPTLGVEVKGQGHTTPKIDLEAWLRHHSRPLRSSTFSSSGYN